MDVVSEVVGVDKPNVSEVVIDLWISPDDACYLHHVLHLLFSRHVVELRACLKELGPLLEPSHELLMVFVLLTVEKPSEFPLIEVQPVSLLLENRIKFPF